MSAKINFDRNIEFTVVSLGHNMWQSMNLIAMLSFWSQICDKECVKLILYID